MSDNITQSQDLILDMCSMDYKVVTVKEGNINGQQIIVTITQNGDKFILPDGINVRLRGSRPDGQPIFEDCEYSESTITIKMTDYILAVPGNAQCELCFTYANDEGNFQLVTSSPFVIYIPESPFKEKTVVKSQTYGALTNALQQVLVNTKKIEGLVDRVEIIEKTWDEEYKEDIENIASNGNQEIANMQAINEEITKNEEVRVTSENNRVSAESDRDDAEKARVRAENTRKNNEAARVSAEEDRDTFEAERRRQENQRVEAEKVRANQLVLMNYSVYNTLKGITSTLKISDNNTHTLELGAGNAYGNSSTVINSTGDGVQFKEKGTYLITCSISTNNVLANTGLKVSITNCASGDCGSQFINLFPSTESITYSLYFVANITQEDSIKQIQIQKLGSNEVTLSAPTNITVIKVAKE